MFFSCLRCWKEAYLGVSFEKNILSKTFFVKKTYQWFSQGFSNSTMEIKVAQVFWKLKHHCPNTFYYKISQNSTMVENIHHGTIVLYGPWENTAYPMFMHWSISLGWLWNCNVVNQKASFLCTLYIYIYLYIARVWYLAKCMTRRHFFRLKYIYFHFTCK